MNVETINETINVCKYVGYEKKVKYIEGDVILQDIKPDILSIVKISRDVCITEIKAEENKIKITGDVNIGIIYIADDSTNSQRGANSKINFSETIDMKDVNENSIIKLKYEVGNVEYKVSNGRKISIRLPINFHVKAFKNCDIDIIKGIRDNDEMQTQKMIQNLCTPIENKSTIIELKENVKLSDTNPSIGEILESHLFITNKEYKLSYNKILAKADAKVKIIYTADNESQTIQSFETTIPIMGFIDFEGINDNSNISLEYTIKDYLIRPSYQDTEANSILIDANIQVDAYAYEKRDVELITDFYTPSLLLKTENQENKVLKDFIDVQENIELNQTLVVPELANTNILNIDGYASINEKNILNGKVAVTGNIDIAILYSKNGSKIIESKKLELPFQQVVKADKLNKDMQAIVYSESGNITYRVNGENQIEVSIPLTVYVSADNEENINSIVSIQISDEKPPRMPSLVVYFVKHGDSLWKIAKHFRSTVDYIKAVNDLKDDVIYPGQRLLIPKFQHCKNTMANLM